MTRTIQTFRASTAKELNTSNSNRLDNVCQLRLPRHATGKVERCAAPSTREKRVIVKLGENQREYQRAGATIFLANSNVPG